MSMLLPHNIFVQRILNRSIFLRICEDKSLENYESLRKITTYQELKRFVCGC